MINLIAILATQLLLLIFGLTMIASNSAHQAKLYLIQTTVLIALGLVKSVRAHLKHAHHVFLDLCSGQIDQNVERLCIGLSHLLQQDSFSS